MTTKKKVSIVFFSVFFTLLIGLFVITWKKVSDTKTERLPLAFRVAITKIKFQHGSSLTAFTDLSNGQHYMLTFPVYNMSVGDSVIKIKNQPYFIIKKASGIEVGKVALNGNRMK